jgi:hypothetical protein
MTAYSTGKVEFRLGVATLAMAGGLALTTRPDNFGGYHALASGHPDLVTVAVPLRDGGFLVTQKAETVVGGAGLAAALSSISLYGLDLRLWISWPQSPQDLRNLYRNLAELAEATGATVWTPEPGAHIVLLDGCLDLAIRSEGGRVASWSAYSPPGAPVRFESDMDGRIAPIGTPTVRQAGNLSIAARRDSHQRSREIGRQPGLAFADLIVLPDGRLGVPYADGSELAAGPRQLTHLLSAAGWAGEDLCLLSPVHAEQASIAGAHLRALCQDLNADIYCPAPGAELSIEDGKPRAVWPDGRSADWHRIGGHHPPHWRSSDGFLEDASPSDLLIPPMTQEPPAPGLPEEPLAEFTEYVPAAPPHARAAPKAEIAVVLPPARDRRPSGLSWLPAEPPVNKHPLQLWLCNAPPSGLASAEGIPSPELFLIGESERPSGRRIASVYVDAGVAISLHLIQSVLPERLRPEPGRYLIPAGWLDRVRYSGNQEEPVILRCTGADHGIDGLPNELAFWPGNRSGHAFVAYPARGRADFLPAYRDRPAASAGMRLLQVRVGRDAAIDVRASAGRLAELRMVRSRLADLVEDRVDLAIPLPHVDLLSISRAFEANGGMWRPIARPDQLLSELLAG